MHFVKQGAGGPWGRQATNCRLGYVPAILERRDISPGPVEPGGKGVDFGRSVNPIPTREGTDYAHHFATCPLPPQNFRRSAGPEDVTYVPRDAARVP